MIHEGEEMLGDIELLAGYPLADGQDGRTALPYLDRLIAATPLPPSSS